MSTCFISTSTSYFWRSDVWLPTKRLPGRRSDDDVLGRNCFAVSSAHRTARHTTTAERTLCARNGEEMWLASSETGVMVDWGEGWAGRCSSVPSSVAVMGVGMSLAGASMSAVEGLLWASAGGWPWSGSSWGGGVGCCMGASRAGLALLSWVVCRGPLNSWAVLARDSSGGQVARPVMLSCSTGETMASSGVGIVRSSGAAVSMGRGLLAHAWDESRMEGARLGNRIGTSGLKKAWRREAWLLEG